jgi:hypothetical protein
MTEGQTSSISRRRFVGRFVGLSVAVFSGIAARDAAADTPEGGGASYACCSLYSKNSCPGTGSKYTCPSGYTKRTWTCCAGGRMYGCGECTKGPTCRKGPWYPCSEGWYIGTALC